MYNSKSKSIFNLCKNISKVYNNKNAVYNLMKQYNNNDWEKYIFNYTNINKSLYKDNLINVYLIKWPTHYILNSFNTDEINFKNSNTFIKILKGSLLKTEYIDSLPDNIDTLNYKENNLLFIKKNTLYSINNNIILNNNYPVTLHVNINNK